MWTETPPAARSELSEYLLHEEILELAVTSVYDLLVWHHKLMNLQKVVIQEIL